MNLATVEKVVAVQHHPNADKLDIIRVLGYDCIVGRDQYKVDDLCVFVQPDSLLPLDKTWCQDLIRYTSKGRIRAVRLRGEWSMGLVVPLEDALDFDPEMHDPMVEEGEDLTEQLGVSKYEPALPKNTQARGGLPFQIPRTDEDRWQNIRKLDELIGETCDVTLKIDGSSATYYCLLGGQWPGEGQTKVGICSRSLELKTGEDENGVAFNSKWHEAERRYNILEKLRTYCEQHNVSLALRGEIHGAGIQTSAHNPHSNGEVDFSLYGVYNITTGKYERRGSDYYFPAVAVELGLPIVPILQTNEINMDLITMYDKEMKKFNRKPFEGVVINHANGSFKVINKWYDAEKE